MGSALAGQRKSSMPSSNRCWIIQIGILGNYWKHSIAVLTHGKCLGRTEEEQYAKFKQMLDRPNQKRIKVERRKKS
jgi:hypothetical protein